MTSKKEGRNGCKKGQNQGNQSSGGRGSSDGNKVGSGKGSDPNNFANDCERASEAGRKGGSK
ncbi:MAG: stress-induced protein [Meiothermus sp.]